MKIILEFNSMEEHDEYVRKEYEKQYSVAHQLEQEREFDKDVSFEVTNGEHFKDEIDKIDEIESGCGKGVDRTTKAPVSCYSLSCYQCLFVGTKNKCNEDFDNWLSQPYKENENVK